MPDLTYADVEERRELGHLCETCGWRLSVPALFAQRCPNGHATHPGACHAWDCPPCSETEEVAEALREAGKEKQALGESLRHQRAAAIEVAIFDWTAKADRAVNRLTDLDAVDDREAYKHAVYVYAGALREAVEQAIAECERDFLATREAGQR